MNHDHDETLSGADRDVRATIRAYRDSRSPKLHRELMEWGEPLVREIVTKYRHRRSPKPLMMVELVEAGRRGLDRAIENFDIDGGTQFSTYATWWIRWAITYAITSQQAEFSLDRITKATTADLPEPPQN